MNWYKIRVKDGSEGGYTFAGCSPETVEQILEKAARGEYLRLDGLLYYDSGEIKTWSQWDNREAPFAYINPVNIVVIQPFKGDPRTLSK